MAYLQLDDLTTHLQPEIIAEITRETAKEFANLAAFPATGVKRYYYKALDTSKYYTWDGTSYNETAFANKAVKAINTGVQEAMSYLTRYNTIAMFSDNDTLRTYQSDLLDSKVKDLAVWQLLTLCNPNANLEVYRSRFEDAMKWFKEVQQGKIDPPFPLKENDPATSQDEAGLVEYRTNKKRTNYY